MKKKTVKTDSKLYLIVASSVASHPSVVLEILVHDFFGFVCVPETSSNLQEIVSIQQPGEYNIFWEWGMK